MEPKFNIGSGVGIINTNSNYVESIVSDIKRDNDNNYVLCEGEPMYSLLLIFPTYGNWKKSYWYRESQLKLVCSNLERGKQILKFYGVKI